ARATSRTARSGATLRTTAGIAARGLLRLVHRLAELHRDLRQSFGLGLDLFDIVGAEHILHGLDRALHRLALARRALVAGFLRHAAWRRRNADQIELAEQFVVGRHLAFALEDADRHRSLVVLGGREGLALLGRDRRVAIDKPGEDAAQGLDAERQRGDVEQQDVLNLALQHAGLDRRADRDDLVRVDAAMRLAAEELLDGVEDLRHAGHAADQDHLVDLGGLDAGILQRVAARLDRLLDQIVDQLFELGARQLDVEVYGPVLLGGDERQVDVGLHRGGQLDFRLFRRLFQALQGELVVAQVDALLLFELIGQVVDDLLVEILAAEKGVAIGRFDFE